MKVKIVIFIFIFISLNLYGDAQGIDPNWLYHTFGVQLKIGVKRYQSRNIYIKIHYGEAVLKGFNLNNVLRTNEVIKLTYSNNRIYHNGLLYEKLVVDKLDVITLIGVSKNGRDFELYRGNFDFIPYNNTIMPINRLMAEEYLYSVVPSEIGNNFPDEAIKAQSVAARSYLYFNLKNCKYEQFDMLDDVSSQMYLGYSRENSRINKLVNETANVVAAYNNQPIEALYHSTSGGQTANNEDVWGGKPISYLRSVDDNNNGIKSPRSSWSLKISKWEIEQIFGVINPTKITPYEKAGIRVKSVRISGNNDLIVSGNEFRRKIGYTKVFSTVFDVKKVNNSFFIEGKGSGHGVGMAQWGAYGLSEKGYTYREILKHYYTNVEVKKIANFEKYAIMGR